MNCSCFRNYFKRITDVRVMRKIVVRQLAISNQNKLDSEKQIEDVVNEGVEVKMKISKAMKAYLQRAQSYDKFMKQELIEYNIGKRHLANMMGENPETFTQSDIDRSIQYLFPSGLFEPRARPFIKSPEDVFPEKKAAEFDDSGRPFHYLFYTGNPNIFELLHECVKLLKELNDFEDEMIKKNIKPDPNMSLNLFGSEWLTKEELENKLLEDIGEIEYKQFLAVMERVIMHPYSYRIQEFIMAQRKPLMAQKKIFEIPEPEQAEDGRMFVTAECRRKRSQGVVKLFSPGTGLISVNEQGLNYFEDFQSREQILFPLSFVGKLNKVDIEASVEYGSPVSQAGALRYGISLALRSFVDQDMVEKMKVAGLLTEDRRRKERKKVGQEGARKKYTWLKR